LLDVDGLRRCVATGEQHGHHGGAGCRHELAHQDDRIIFMFGDFRGDVWTIRT
jgi:hypothetical protein